MARPQTGGPDDRRGSAPPRARAQDRHGRDGRDPHDLLARYELAFATWIGGNHRTPFEQFLEITRQDPMNAMNHGYLGYIYSTRNDARNTVAQWEEGVRLDPSNSVLHYMLGSLLPHRAHAGRGRAVQPRLSRPDPLQLHHPRRGTVADGF